jgi:hypothetical protein
MGAAGRAAKQALVSGEKEPAKQRRSTGKGRGLGEPIYKQGLVSCGFGMAATAILLIYCGLGEERQRLATLVGHGTWMKEAVSLMMTISSFMQRSSRPSAVIA